ncbi:MAG: hypothetical protein JW882_03970, partial [Deltaproteobacteria bacterium]|nr:hypothetical protein [Deltaproteobacteria bacterium]
QKKRLSACLAFLDLVYMQTHANYMQVPLLKKKKPKKLKEKVCVCIFLTFALTFTLLFKVVKFFLDMILIFLYYLHCDPPACLPVHSPESFDFAQDHEFVEWPAEGTPVLCSRLLRRMERRDRWIQFVTSPPLLGED